MAATSEQVTIQAADDSHLRATWKNLCVVVWRGAVTKAATDGVAEAFEQLRRSQNSGVGLCVIIEESSPLPGADERQWSKDLFNRLGKDLHFVAAIPEGKGMWATAARTALTAFALVMPTVYQQRIFSEPAEASQWIAERMTDGKAPGAPAVTTDEVTRAFTEIRTRFPRRVEASKQKASGGFFSFLRKS